MPEIDAAALLDRGQFTKELRTLGMSRYHHEHPFHRAMHEGRLTPEQLRGWVANRYHYQRNIPLKDAAILSNCPDREVRRIWIHRLGDHDGRSGEEGGLEAWLRLAEAVGLGREETLEGRLVLPGVRRAVESYVQFARTEPWPIAVASSLTELFAPDLMKERLAAFETHYQWVRAEGLDYFRGRVTQARKDSSEGLDLVIAHCTTRELQERAVRALSFKCDLLWSMLEAIALAFGMGSGARDPGTRAEAGPFPPRGAWTSEEDRILLRRPRLSARVRLRTDPVSGKPVLLYPEGVMILNPTGEAIVGLLDGVRTVPDIVRALAARYRVSAEVLTGDVEDYLGRLLERQVLDRAG
jgi:pyrroloquinoline-quinone synthase